MGIELGREPMPWTPGTYVLSGRLRERGSRDLPVAGAQNRSHERVRHRACHDHKRRRGVFSVWRLWRDDLHVTEDGYSGLTQTFSVTDRRGSMSIELLYLGGHPDLSGTYTLTITAASDCAVSVLAKVACRKRSGFALYTAAVEQDHATLWVTLSGPGFLTEFQSYFYGTIQAERALFSLRNPDDGTPISEWLWDQKSSPSKGVRSF